MKLDLNLKLVASTALVCLVTSQALAVDLTIATVNNSDMIRMQGLSSEFTAANPDIEVAWVTLDENTLRQNVTTDIAMNGGQYDIMTIGTYEVPIWASRGWLVPLTNLGDGYDIDDLIPKIRDSLSYEGDLYAAPFIGESAFTIYRKDLFNAAGIEMPKEPTWEFIIDAASKLNDPDNEVYGICIRGKAGWGENMAIIAAMANSFGARWFDEEWKPEFTGPEWRATIEAYNTLATQYSPPGVSSAGFNENLTLFNSGKCAIWVDDTVAASYVSDPAQSQVSDKLGFALAPNTGLGKYAGWLWSWALAVPAGSKNAEAAQKFVAWATSKEYTQLVAAKDGWSNAPAGTRQSLYDNADYLAAAPFAELAMQALTLVDPNNPSVKPVPYVGVTYPSIPEYPAIGTQVGQLFSAMISGSLSIDDALTQAQDVTTREMERGGYYK